MCNSHKYLVIKTIYYPLDIEHLHDFDIINVAVPQKINLFLFCVSLFEQTIRFYEWSVKCSVGHHIVHFHFDCDMTSQKCIHRNRYDSTN